MIKCNKCQEIFTENLHSQVWWERKKDIASLKLCLQRFADKTCVCGDQSGWWVCLLRALFIHTLWKYSFLLKDFMYQVLNDKVKFFSSLQRRGVHGIILCWNCSRDPKPKKCLQVNWWISQWVYSAVVKILNEMSYNDVKIWNHNICSKHFCLMDVHVRYNT